MQLSKPAGETDATLIALRTRLLDLHSNLTTLRDYSSMLRDNVGPSRDATFPIFLSVHSTLSKLSEQLTAVLDRLQQEGLPYFATIPTQADPIAPELLRTRLDVDVEREFQAMADAFKGDATQKVLRYNQTVETVLKAVADGRERLERPRPSEVPPPLPSATADEFLAAMTNGSHLAI